MQKIELGRWVIDRVSGVQGVSQTRSEMLSGTAQISVQPRVKDGSSELPQSFSFDEQQVDYATPPADFVAPVVTPPPSQDAIGIELGNVVEELVTKLEGTVTTRVTFLNGCVYFVVVPDQTKKDAKEEIFSDWKRFQKKGEGLAKKIAKRVQEVTGDKPRPPGGPTTRARRIC